jgi:hypothetical protein
MILMQFDQPIPVVTPLGDAYAIYVRSNGTFENDEVLCALKDTGQWRHFLTSDIKSCHNETYQIKK